MDSTRMWRMESVSSINVRGSVPQRAPARDRSRARLVVAAPIVLVAVALAGCDRDAERVAIQAPQPAPASMVPSPPVEPGGKLVYNPRTDEMLFVFDGIGTALTIPHAWQEGDVSIEKLATIGASPCMRAYGARFHPAQEDPQRHYHVALIRVYDEARWQALGDAERASEIELAHMDGKVYSYATVPPNPLPDGTAESERFDQLVISGEDAPTRLAIKKSS